MFFYINRGKFKKKSENLFKNIWSVYKKFIPLQSQKIKKRDGVVAQLVEQRTENPCVTGSNPVDATQKSRGVFQ